MMVFWRFFTTWALFRWLFGANRKGKTGSSFPDGGYGGGRSAADSGFFAVDDRWQRLDGGMYDTPDDIYDRADDIYDELDEMDDML